MAGGPAGPGGCNRNLRDRVAAAAIERTKNRDRRSAVASHSATSTTGWMTPVVSGDTIRNDQVIAIDGDGRVIAIASNLEAQRAGEVYAVKRVVAG